MSKYYLKQTSFLVDLMKGRKFEICEQDSGNSILWGYYGSIDKYDTECYSDKDSKTVYFRILPQTLTTPHIILDNQDNKLGQIKWRVFTFYKTYADILDPNGNKIGYCKRYFENIFDFFYIPKFQIFINEKVVMQSTRNNIISLQHPFEILDDTIDKKLIFALAVNLFLSRNYGNG